MTEEQIKEYLEKYSLTTKEKLAEHIEQLKRNTNPNLVLISELVFVLADEENLFFNVFCGEKEDKYKTNGSQGCWAFVYPYLTFEDKIKNFVTLNLEPKIVGDLEGINKPPHRAVSSHFLDEVLEDLSQKENKTEENKGHSTRLKANTPLPLYPSLEERDKSIEDSFKNTLKVLTGEGNREDSFTVGKKESEGKLEYELDWNFIQQMAERMQTNKGKYKPYNWKLPMDVEKLKQSLFRHVIEIMKGNYEDEGREFGHLESVSDNAMMINYQLKNKVK